MLETLRWLVRSTRVWVEVTNLVIPGENDSHDEIGQMCDWLAENLGPDVPIHFTAFHPDFKMRDKPRTPLSTLVRARRQALERGLRYMYCGNVHDPASQSTWCPGCGQCVIERDWYELGDWRLQDGRCTVCQTTIAGHFQPQPGTWGQRRQRVAI